MPGSQALRRPLEPPVQGRAAFLVLEESEGEGMTCRFFGFEPCPMGRDPAVEGLPLEEGMRIVPAEGE